MTQHPARHDTLSDTQGGTVVNIPCTSVVFDCLAYPITSGLMGVIACRVTLVFFSMPGRYECGSYATQPTAGSGHFTQFLSYHKKLN